MANWMSGKMKVRGPFNRIIDFIWNGLDLDQSRNEGYRKSFKETLCDPEYSDCCREEVLTEAFYGAHGDGGFVHIKGTHRNFVDAGHCDTVICWDGPLHSEALKDLYMAKLGEPIPTYINPIQKIINGIPHINVIYKYENNDDLIVEFDISCAWDIDVTSIPNIALRFGIDIKIQGVEPGQGFYRTLDVTRFGKINICEFKGLYTPDDLWNCPYPVPFMY